MAYNGKKMEWEVEETLADVQINDTNRLVVDVNKSSTGLVSIGVREFWTPDGGDNWYPGKKGMALKPELWSKLLPAMQAWLDNQTTEDSTADEAPRGNGRKLGEVKVPARRIKAAG